MDTALIIGRGSEKTREVVLDNITSDNAVGLLRGVEGIPEHVLARIQTCEWVVLVAQVTHLEQSGPAACFHCIIESCR